MYCLGHLCVGHLPGHLLSLSSTARLTEPVVMAGQALHTSQSACFAHPGIAEAVLFQQELSEDPSFTQEWYVSCKIQSEATGGGFSDIRSRRQSSAAIAAALDAWPILKYAFFTQGSLQEALLWYPPPPALMGQLSLYCFTSTAKNRKSWYTA